MKKYLLPLILILCLAFTLTGFCWVAGYDQRIKLTVDHTKVDDTLTNFPVTAFFTDAQAEEIFAEFDADEDFDRGQFALSDDTLLKAEKELFDDSESLGVYHYKAPSTDPDTDTDIYFYYDNDAGHNTDYIGLPGSDTAAEVWVDYVAVYHMNDPPAFTDWTEQYEATVEPDSDGWTLGGDDYATSDGDILTIDTQVDALKFCYYYQTPDVDFDTGVYVKINCATGVNHQIADALTIKDGTQDEKIIFRLTPAQVSVGGATATNYTIDTTDYHTYEIYIKGTTTKVYIDGILRITHTNVTSGTYDDQIAFGDYSATYKAVINFDYFYYAIDVAHNPCGIIDSTSNANNGTKKGVGEPVEAAGQVGQGQDFDGADDTIDCGAGLAIGTGVRTFTAIVSTSLDDWQTIIGNRNYATDGYCIQLGSGGIQFYNAKAGTGVYITDDYTDGANYLLTVVRNGTAGNAIYINGVSKELGTNTENLDDAADSLNTRMGVQLGATDRRLLDGILDEVQISDTARSAAWDKATYNSLWDTLLTYGSEETPADIDIGSAATASDTNYPFVDTVIVKDNPANDSGRITSIEVYAQSGEDMSDFEVATFYSTGTNQFSTRDNVYIGTVIGGAKRTFSVNLNVEAGDYIGFYKSAGWIEMNSDGGAGYWYYIDEDRIPCTELDFTLTGYTTRRISLYGTGTTEVGIKWNGVTITKWNGITITKINGK